MARRSAAAAAAAVVALAALAGAASAAVYEVGDKTGWTIMGNPNYTAWTSSKRFHVGDTVVFTYNKQFHNVLAVSKADYKDCNATNPTATWSTGNDSVVLKTAGHHYFLCGFPGHCAAGQKVDIRVAGSSAAPSAAPASEPSPAGGKPSGSGAAPAPHPNAAPGPVAGSSLAASLLALAAAAAVLA